MFRIVYCRLLVYNGNYNTNDWGDKFMLKNIHKYNSLNLKTIAYLLFVRIFGNTSVNAFINFIAPIILSLLLAIPSEKRDNNFNIYIYVLIVFIVVFNLFSCVAIHIKSQNEKWKSLLSSVTEHISAIHIETGTNIYRMHKHTKSSITKNQLVDKTHFNQIADFQEMSFLVCKSIYDIIESELECDECEVTVYQKFLKKKNKKYDNIKMIAYATKGNVIPSTYDKNYVINKKAQNTVFMGLFKNNQSDAVICHNQKSVNEKFIWLAESEEREKRIHQYIGIPIKSNSNNVVCILQIDVSQKKLLGKNYKEVKYFADDILKPFSSILYNAYERDNVFNTFYDVWADSCVQGK